MVNVWPEKKNARFSSLTQMSDEGPFLIELSKCRARALKHSADQRSKEEKKKKKVDV